MHERALPAQSLLARGCLHRAALHAAVGTGAAQQVCNTPGQLKDRSDLESPLIYVGVNQTDIWLEIKPVHIKPRGLGDLAQGGGTATELAYCYAPPEKHPAARQQRSSSSCSTDAARSASLTVLSNPLITYTTLRSKGMVKTGGHDFFLANAMNVVDLVGGRQLSIKDRRS